MKKALTLFFIVSLFIFCTNSFPKKNASDHHIQKEKKIPIYLYTSTNNSFEAHIHHLLFIELRKEISHRKNLKVIYKKEKASLLLKSSVEAYQKKIKGRNKVSHYTLCLSTKVNLEAKTKENSFFHKQKKFHRCLTFLKDFYGQEKEKQAQRKIIKLIAFDMSLEIAKITQK